MVLELKELNIDNYEKVIEAINKEAGLHAFIAIHNLTMGPALGGTRIYPYASAKDALTDVLRLSQGMTYKSALAETGLGGGKSVIIADPKKDKTEKLLEAFGEAVDCLKGSYICAEDSGTNTEDMMIVRRKTAYVAGLPTATSSGDPSRFTAWGILKGLQAVAKTIWGSESLKGKTIAIQGLGSVGIKVAEHLFWQEANLILSDLNDEKMHAYGQLYRARTVSSDQILEVECDILCPCAMGGILNEKSINKLNCKAVAGAANNQLLKEEDGKLLHDKAILYAPDFVINSGGIINVAYELEKDLYNPQKAIAAVNKIYDTLITIFETSKKQNIATSLTALQFADYKLANKIGKRKEPLNLKISRFY
jgi:leucine dehydrogenase